MSETASYTPRLKAAYNDTIRAKIQEELGLKNVMQIPKLEKVVINMGVGDAVNDRKSIEKAFEEMQAIAGQKPVVTKAKKSIAGFKVREEMALGVKVTLRKDRMYEFFDRLTNAITNGTAAARMGDNSMVLTDVKETFFNGDPDYFKGKIREWIDQFGISSEDVKNLTVSALISKMIPQADADVANQLNGLLGAAERFGFGNKPAKNFL